MSKIFLMLLMNLLALSRVNADAPAPRGELTGIPDKELYRPETVVATSGNDQKIKNLEDMPTSEVGLRILLSLLPGYGAYLEDQDPPRTLDIDETRLFVDCMTGEKLVIPLSLFDPGQMELRVDLPCYRRDPSDVSVRFRHVLNDDQVLFLWYREYTIPPMTIVLGIVIAAAALVGPEPDLNLKQFWTRQLAKALPENGISENNSRQINRFLQTAALVFARQDVNLPPEMVEAVFAQLRLADMVH